MHKSITLARILDMVEEDDDLGVCLSCGAEAYEVEPDGREYECAECHEMMVYGAEEILIML